MGFYTNDGGTYFVVEELLNDLVRQFVDVNVFVVLQAFDFIETATFLNLRRNLLQISSSQLENVVNAVQDNLHNLRVLAAE